MKITATFLLLSLFNAAVFTVNASEQLRHRVLEDAANDDAAEAEEAAGDDAVAGDDAAGDDAAVVTDDDYTAYNGTFSDRVKDYTNTHIQESYETTPSEWSNEQWGFFAGLMFIFGSISSLFFLLFVFPCCCPNAMRTAYARFIVTEDSKKVNLIHR